MYYSLNIQHFTKHYSNFLIQTLLTHLADEETEAQNGEAFFKNMHLEKIYFEPKCGPKAITLIYYNVKTKNKYTEKA